MASMALCVGFSKGSLEHVLTVFLIIRGRPAHDSTMHRADNNYLNLNEGKFVCLLSLSSETSTSSHVDCNKLTKGSSGHLADAMVEPNRMCRPRSFSKSCG